jgi:uncharacterized protein with PIN domain
MDVAICDAASTFGQRLFAAIVPDHRQLVETADDERRVILTCDRVFVRARHSESTYFVRSERKQEQLEEVRQRHSTSCRW